LSEWLHWLSDAPVTDCSDGAPVYFNNFLFSSWYIDSKCMFLYIKEKNNRKQQPTTHSEILCGQTLSSGSMWRIFVAISTG